MSALRRLPLERFAALLPPRQVIFQTGNFTPEFKLSVDPQVVPPQLQPQVEYCSLCGLLETMRPDCKTCMAIYAPKYRNQREYVKGKAHRAVAKAVREGELPQLGITCVDCGKLAVDWEHRDYGDKLKVEPVCRHCNIMRGPGRAS